MRVLGSHTFGLNTSLTNISTGLVASPSENLFVLGDGHIGGKGDGLIFLDHVQREVGGYSMPRSLLVCHDWFGIPGQPLDKPSSLESIDDGKLATLFDTIESLNLSGMLAIRASAQVEDMKGNPAAGVFDTRFHGMPLSSAESKRSFIAKLLSVCNSAYTEHAQRHWKQQGYSAIPPIPVIIQDVVGSVSESHPQYFFPIVAGISNGALHTAVRVRTVLGLGGSAVDHEGLGTLHSLQIRRDGRTVSANKNKYTGDLNETDVRVMDARSGDAVRLQGANATKVFSGHLIDSAYEYMPYSQMDIAELNLGFERMLGHPVDLEWASTDLKKLSLLQCRAIQKRPPVEKPQPLLDDVLVRSSVVYGFGSKTFSTVIFASFYYGCPSKRTIADLAQRYPNSLVVYMTNVTYPDTIKDIEARFFPHFDTVVVNDINDCHRSSTLSHFDLNCEATGKVLVHAIFRAEDKLERRGTVVEHLKEGGPFSDSFKVYQLKQPIGVAADSEFEWGKVYWVSE